MFCSVLFFMSFSSTNSRFLRVRQCVAIHGQVQNIQFCQQHMVARTISQNLSMSDVNCVVMYLSDKIINQMHY